MMMRLFCQSRQQYFLVDILLKGLKNMKLKLISGLFLAMACLPSAQITAHAETAEETTVEQGDMSSLIEPLTKLKEEFKEITLQLEIMQNKLEKYSVLALDLEKLKVEEARLSLERDRNKVFALIISGWFAFMAYNVYKIIKKV